MNTYDELYVVSDIHLGGEKSAEGNFQIFKYGARLGGFVNEIALRANNDKSVALVLNGDIFDSLAEEDVPGYVALSETQALSMITRIYNDASFTPVWSALEIFVSTPNCQLIFVIGNHDIELALPVVQHYLISSISKDNSKTQSQITFAATGGGYTCMVGKSRVYCTHGNEMDAWNWVDYNNLGQLANAMNAGRSIKNKRWKPNAGTRLVVDVMNIVKKRYPFVDILKPEGSAIAAVLLALDSVTFSKLDLSDGIPVVRDMRRGSKITDNLLGADSAQSSSPEDMRNAYLQDIVGPNLRKELQLADSSTLSEKELLLDAETMLDSEDWQVDETDTEGIETLGWIGDVLPGLLGIGSKPERLRKALLDWLGKNAEFETAHKDATYENIQKRVSDNIDIVVTGHTHMPKSIPMKQSGHYYNTGTWIRTLRFTQACLEDKDHFHERVWPVLKDGDLKDLDTLKIKSDHNANKEQNLLFDRTSAVRILNKENKVTSELLRITDGRTLGKVIFNNEPGTKPIDHI